MEEEKKIKKRVRKKDKSISVVKEIVKLENEIKRQYSFGFFISIIAVSLLEKPFWALMLSVFAIIVGFVFDKPKKRKLEYTGFVISAIVFIVSIVSILYIDSDNKDVRFELDKKTNAISALSAGVLERFIQFDTVVAERRINISNLRNYAVSIENDVKKDFDNYSLNYGGELQYRMYNTNGDWVIRIVDKFAGVGSCIDERDKVSIVIYNDDLNNEGYCGE